MAVITGTEGPDRLISSDANSNDTINALGGNDFIEARGGDDLIAPGAGNDRIEGGDGHDTVLLPGSLDDFQLFRHGDEGIIRGPEGVDQTLDVEAFRTDASGTRDFNDVPEFLGYAYLASYKDLAQAFGANEGAAWAHFYSNGAAEGRDITFDGTSYLAANPDVLGSADYGANVNEGAALHYLQFGMAEGRQTDFHGAAYVASYGDLIDAFAGAGSMEAIDAAGTQHFVQYGFLENRAPDQFNEASYAADNPDLAAAGLVTEEQLAWHWIEYGHTEGRAGAYDPVIA